MNLFKGFKQACPEKFGPQISTLDLGHEMHHFLYLRENTHAEQILPWLGEIRGLTE